MILDQTDLSLEIILAAAVAANEAQFVSDWVDCTTTVFTPGMNHGTSNGNTAVTVVAAPGAATQRQVQFLSVYNADTASIALTVRLNHNNTDYRIVWNGALAAGETLGYAAKQGFVVYGTDGNKTLASPSYAHKYRKVIQPYEGEFLQGCTGLPLKTPSAGITSDKAYWNYIGFTLKSFVINHVYFYVSTVGAGAQTAEVALVRSINPPNKANQTLYKLTASGNLVTLTVGVARKYNLDPLAYKVPAGIHLWAGMRTAMATTQPRCYGFNFSFGEGMVLSTAAAGALTGAGPWTGSVIAVSSGVWQAPIIGLIAQRGKNLR